jgi:hypothetical protein
MDASENTGDLGHDYVRDVYTAPDTTLSMLAGLSNSGKVAFEVTLTVGGAVVIGTLMSDRDFFDAMADALDHAVGDGDVGPLADGMRVLSADPAADGQLSDYIHLRSVEVTTGGEPVILAFWRGRLAHVSGWMLGRSTGHPPA